MLLPYLSYRLLSFPPTGKGESVLKARDVSFSLTDLLCLFL